MSDALQFWSALVVPLTLMLAAPKLPWLLLMVPAAAAAAAFAASFAPADLGTALILLVALTGIGCGLALRVMGEFVWRLWSGR